MDYFMELYGTLPRAGPGGREHTRRAFDMIVGLPSNLRILDIGCGPGIQTLELAMLTEGRMTAIDLMPQMIERMNSVVIERGLEDRVEVLQMDMNDIDFPKQEFDLVWSEGAIYIMGFRNGLEKVRPFVKDGGFVVVSEAVWLKPDPPEEVQGFWEEYPEIASIDEKLEVIEELKYEILGHFVLPPEAWTRDYYDHLESKADELEKEWESIPEAMEIIKVARDEVDIFKRFHNYYGYCFFVMKK
ncbi:MAG: methyltransferase domain-containing protein [Candidatus Hydrothermarchaeales archaeon]